MESKICKNKLFTKFLFSCTNSSIINVNIGNYTEAYFLFLRVKIEEDGDNKHQILQLDRFSKGYYNLYTQGEGDYNKAAQWCHFLHLLSTNCIIKFTMFYRLGKRKNIHPKFNDSTVYAHCGEIFTFVLSQKIWQTLIYTCFKVQMICSIVHAKLHEGRAGHMTCCINDGIKSKPCFPL